MQKEKLAGALDGIRVIEVASYVTGPFAGALLGDLGAEVFKIEEPGHGDPFRGWGADQYSPTFRALNRNKKSVVLDLRNPAGREILMRMIKTADVVIENHRPGVAERMGFGYEMARENNPRLVYCSVTGFGMDGPYVGRPGYDTVGQALSGLLSLLTNLDHPQPMGISLSDHITGLYACCGVLAALAARFVTGQGQRISTSLLQATLHLESENAAHYFHHQSAPVRETRVRQAQVFAFRAEDGLPFVIHLSSPVKFWHGLADAVGRPEWKDDERFASHGGRQSHYDILSSVLQEVFQTAPREVWLELLSQHDVPVAPLNTLEEAFDDPQVQHLGLRWTYAHPMRGPVDGVATGFGLSATPPAVRLAPPVLGEHTDSVLRGIGASESDLDMWQNAGAFGKRGDPHG